LYLEVLDQTVLCNFEGLVIFELEFVVQKLLLDLGQQLSMLVNDGRSSGEGISTLVLVQ
jgi:hypothetical protein